MLIGFTRDNTYLLSFFLGALALPNVLAQLIFLLRKKHPAPAMSFHLTVLIMNVGYALLIYSYVIHTTYSGMKWTGYTLLFVGLFFILVPIDKYVAPTSFEGNHFVYRELVKGVFDAEKFQNLVRDSRAAPPIVRITAEAGHWERHVKHIQITDRNGHTRYVTEEHQEFVVTWTQVRELNYTSWEEVGNSIRLDNLSVLHATFTLEPQFDEPTQAELDAIESEMYIEGRTHDAVVLVSHKCTIENMQTAVSAVLGKHNFFTKLYGASGSKYLWALAALLGYQSLFECFWTSQGERMIIPLVKRISLTNGFRAKRGEPDYVASEQSFKVGDVMPIIGPNNNDSSPYLPPSQTTLIP